MGLNFGVDLCVGNRMLGVCGCVAFKSYMDDSGCVISNNLISSTHGLARSKTHCRLS